jgi:hypothetical protein
MNFYSKLTKNSFDNARTSSALRIFRGFGVCYRDKRNKRRARRRNNAYRSGGAIDFWYLLHPTLRAQGSSAL